MGNGVNMTKWEYAEIEVIIGGPLSGTKSDCYIYKSNGKHEESSDRYGVLFAKMGEDGWELVCSSARIESGLGSKHVINYMMKRPIE
jgi:hypothetical protein